MECCGFLSTLLLRTSVRSSCAILVSSLLPVEFSASECSLPSNGLISFPGKQSALKRRLLWGLFVLFGGDLVY